MSKVQRLSAILVVGLSVSAVAIAQPQAPSAAGPAVPDAFGPGDQVLHIAAAAFQPVSSNMSYFESVDRPGCERDSDDRPFLVKSFRPLLYGG